MGLFDGGSGAADKAQGAYEGWMNKAVQNYQDFWKQGRGDIMGMYGQGLGFLNPYMKAGQQALGDYQSSLGEGGGQPGVPGAPQGPGEAQQGVLNKFKSSPGYQFQLQQGLGAINRQSDAKGLGGSGGTLKALQQYGQGMANQDYGKYQQQLGGLAGMGQQAAGQAFQGALGTGQELGQLGAQYAGDIGGAYGGMGTSAANSIMGGYGADQAQQSNWMNQLGMLGGAGLGFMAGGPMGAYYGAGIGGAAGGAAGSWF